MLHIISLNYCSTIIRSTKCRTKTLHSDRDRTDSQSLGRVKFLNGTLFFFSGERALSRRVKVPGKKWDTAEEKSPSGCSACVADTCSYVVHSLSRGGLSEMALC